MRKFNKIVCMILAVAVMMSCTGVAMADNTSSVSEETNELLMEKYELLKAIGVYEDAHEMHYFDELLTREQYASILSGFYGVTVEMSESSQEAQTIYSDVPYDKWSAGSIFFLTDRGVMSGYTDGKFRPESPITIEQAVKGIVITLGYEAQANYLGGYPKGYTNVASQLGIISYNSSYDKNITCGEFIEMLYKTLHTEMQEMKGYSEDGIIYEVREGDLALGRYFDVYIEEGILNVNGGSALAGETPMKKGNVKVGRVKYQSDRDFFEFFGRNVRLYYKQSRDMGVGKALYMTINGTHNAVTTVLAEDITAVSSGKISYLNKKGRTISVKLPGNVNVIYNGRLKLLYKKEDLMPKVGSVTLVDANNDSVIETVVVESYLNYYVANSGESGELFVITDKGEKTPVKFDYEKDEVFVLRDGEEILPASIKKGEILSVAADVMDEKGVKAEASYYKILASDETVRGTITAFGDGEATIKDVIYNLSGDYDMKKYPIKSGSEGIFYLDIFGNIAAMSDETEESYAFLVTAGQKKGVNTKVEVKLFSADGRMYVLDCAENIKIDGYPYAGKANMILDSLSVASASYREKTGFVSENSKGYEQLVHYRLNKDNEVSFIDTVESNKGFKSAEEDGMNFALLLEASPAQNVYYFAKGNTLWGKIAPIDSTVLFNIPSDLQEEENYSAAKYLDTVDSAENTGTKYMSDIAVFDSDEFYRAGALVLAGSANNEVQEKELNNMILVEKFVYAMNKDTEAVKAVVGYRVKDGTKVTVKPKTNKILEDAKIEVGDIMRWSSDTDGNAVVIEKTCSPLGADDGTFLGETAPHKHDFRFYTDFRITVGNAVALDGDAIRIHYSVSKLFAPSTDEVNHLNSLAIVLVYDTETGVVSRGSIMDIKTEQDFGEGNGSKIFTYQQYSVLKSVVVYK